MKIKNIIAGLLLGGVLITNSSCEDFTDIKPKGMNLLTDVTQLDMLLNYRYSFDHNDWTVMCGDGIFASSTHVPNEISKPTKTRQTIMWTWDEDAMDKLAELTNSDNEYVQFYNIIGTVANPVLSLVDAAEGDEEVKKSLKAEALTIRAYFHFLLVNKFAKAYNPSTAAQTPGIIYMTEDQNLLTPAKKLTLQEVYDKMLTDIDAAIALEALPESAVNLMRINKPAAYAVKAMILTNMQKFDEAAKAAQQALALNSTVNNYNTMLSQTSTQTGNVVNVIYRQRLTCVEDLFYVHCLEYPMNYTPEAWNAFEKGHACKDKMNTDLLVSADGTAYQAESVGLTGYIQSHDERSGWNSLGLKTTQMYLIIAEAEINNDKYDAAMEALDAIRVNRIDPAVYQPLKGNVRTKEEAIFHLKQTAHGENIYSCYNFINKKRWNQISGWEETITRTIAGVTYTLTSTSPMWIFPFPQDVLSNNPNITQNYKDN